MTTTPAKGLTQPVVSGDNNIWGGELNTDLSLLDQALGGTLTKSISGNVTLTATEAQNTGFRFSGTLFANATVTFPAFFGFAALRNSTTGGFSINCGISGGASVLVLSGEMFAVWSDGTDFIRLGPALNGWLPVYGALLSSGPNPTTAGTGYVPGDLVTLTGGTFSSAATIRVLDTQVVSATVNAGGSGGTSGTQTVSGTTGTTGIAGGGAKFSASVTITGGAITAVLSITVPGDYIVNPTSLIGEPVTGASLTGATLNLTMGVSKFVVQTGGSYTVVPAGSPVTMSQGSTSGTGTGATFPISFGPVAATVPYPINNEAHTGGADNLAIGSLALSSLTTGYFNLAIGVNALKNNTSGPESLAIGWHALENYTGTSGAGSLAIGTAAGRNATTPSGLLAIGTDAANGGVTNPTDVMAIGHSALSGGGGNVGNNGVYIGNNAGKFGAVTRVTNVIVGQNAVPGKSDNTSAYTRLTVVGSNALSGANLVAPTRTVVIGDIAGGSAFNANDTVLIGSTAGNSVTNGNSLVIIGSNAGAAVSTGTNNTIIGKNVAQTTLTTGSNNLLLGTNSSLDTAAAATSNTIGLAAGSTAVISATGCGTPSTSITNIAGSLTVGTTGAANTIKILGLTSGSLAFAVPAVAGTNTITWPAGTVDFSATGTASGVVKQTSAGGAFTVAKLGQGDITAGTRAQSQPANPTGTTNGTFTQMGVGFSATPTQTGNLLVTVHGSYLNTVGLTSIQLRRGSGAGPANGAAAGGTLAVQVNNLVSPGANNVPFAFQFYVSGLTLNSAIWIDPAIAVVGGGTTSLYDLTLIAIEV